MCNGGILQIMNKKFVYIALIVTLALLATYFLWYKQKGYVSKDKTTCASIFFVCAPGKKQFIDDVGCGCE